MCSCFFPNDNTFYNSTVVYEISCIKELMQLVSKPQFVFVISSRATLFLLFHLFSLNFVKKFDSLSHPFANISSVLMIHRSDWIGWDRYLMSRLKPCWVLPGNVSRENPVNYE